MASMRLADDGIQFLDSALQFGRVRPFHLLLVEFNLHVEYLFLGLFGRFDWKRRGGSRSGTRRFFHGRVLKIFLQLFDRFLQISNCLHHSSSLVRLDGALVLLQSLNQHSLLLKLLIQQFLFASL